MSAIEKLVVQIFERKKWIIDQAQRQCHLFDQHLVSKLIIDGIAPPPWLRNPEVPSLTSDPKGLNKDELFSEVLFPQSQSTIPLSGRHCSLYSKLVFKTDNKQFPSGLDNEVHALKSDCDAGDGLSNFPDSSVNNAGSVSIGAPEMDSGAISPQNQMEAKPSDNYHEPPLSLAKLQRSKSRQRALQLRNSAKAAKPCSDVDNNATVCADIITDSVTSYLQSDHIVRSNLVKAFDTNIQRHAVEEVEKGPCQTQINDHSNYFGRITRSEHLAQKLNCSGVDDSAGVCGGKITGSMTSSLQLDHIEASDSVKNFNTNIRSGGTIEMEKGVCQTQTNCNSNYSGRITRSKSLAQKFSCLDLVSCPVVDKDGLQSKNVNVSLKLVNPPHHTNGSCKVKEASVGEYQMKVKGSSVCHKRLTRSRTSGQGKCDNELLKLDTTLGRGSGVEVHRFMNAHFDSTDLSKASDPVNGSKRKAANDGDCWNNKQEKEVHGRLVLPRSSAQSPSDDFLVADSSLKSLGKSTQLSHSLISEHLYPPAVPVVGPLQSQQDPDFCAVNASEHLSRISSAEGYITRYSQSKNHIEGKLNSCFDLCDKSSGCSRSDVSDKSQNVRGSEMAAERPSSSQKNSKLDTEIAMDSEEKNVAAGAAGRNTRVVTTCTRYRHSASYKPSLGKSLYIETFGHHKVSDTQENVLSVVNVNDNIDKEEFVATAAEADSDFNGLVEKSLACVGSTLGDISPKVGLDVSVSRLPSHFVMSVKPKHLEFDDVEESSAGGFSSPELNQTKHGLLSEKGPVMFLEPGNSFDEVTSLACQDKCNSSQEMHLLERREILNRDEGPQIENCLSHEKKADVASKALNAISLNKESPETQEELIIHTSTQSQKIPRASSMNHLISSHVDCEKSSGSFPKDIMLSKIVLDTSNLENGECSTKTLTDALSATVTGYGLVGKVDETVTYLIAGLPSAASDDELSVGLMPKDKSSGNFLCQNDDLLSGKQLTDGKYSCLSTGFQIVKNSLDCLPSDLEHSVSQHKRRKIEIQADETPLPASPSFLEKPVESSSQRSINRGLNVKEDNREAVLEVQCLTSHQEEDIVYRNVSNNPIEELQNSEECHPTEESSPKMRMEEGSRDLHNCMMEQMGVANPSSFGIDSTRCTIDENLDTWHHQDYCGRASAEHPSVAERSALRRRVGPGGNARFSDGTPVSQGIAGLDLIGTDEAIPEFEGFIIQQDDVQQCTAGDGIELEKLNIPNNTVEYTSILKHLGRSSLSHSPLCYSSSTYRLHKIPDLYQSLPNGLLEGMGLRATPLLNDENGRSLSDCLPNCKDQSTWDIDKPYVSVQTLWDRITLNFGSSQKRESLKPELPCISEENENADEIADTFHKGIGSEVMTSSIRRGPLAEITDNAMPSASVSQDHVLADKCGLDSVSTEFGFSGAHNKVKQNLEKQASRQRRGTGKGKENQSISLGANRAKTGSVCNRPSRPKLSGKDSLKKGIRGKSACNNIVSNISSFIPLVQQKQAAAAVPGKRDIKVKALEAAEAAKRMAEKKENERNMKKEALRLERERLEQEKQENFRQMELQKKRREEERKKKDAEMAAKKRQREEERKEKERKRKRVDDVKRKQQEHEEKICAKKEEKKIKCQAAGETKQEDKEFVDKGEKPKKLENIGKGNMKKCSEAEPLAIVHPTYEAKAGFLECSEVVNDCDNDGKVIGNVIKATEHDDLIVKNSIQEQSYEISPYKGSDDEDDEDEIPNNKFIPSWSSKHRLSLILSSQKIVDPKTIFPPQSFCDITEVLFPRKLQLK